MAEDAPRMTKYLKIAAALREAISAGEMAPGTMLPSEGEIAEEHRATRSTVRRALELLRGEGLINTAHGTGSWVRQTAPRRYLGPDRYRALAGRGEANTMVHVSAQDAPVPGGTESRFEVRTGGDLPPQLAQWLGVAANEPVYRRDGRFSVAGRGQQLWTSWLPVHRVTGTPLADPGTDPWAGTTIALYHELGWQFQHAREHTWPRMPRADVAKALGITVGIPLLVVERVMYFRHRGAGPLTPLEAAVVLLPGDSTVLVNEVGHPLADASPGT